MKMTKAEKMARKLVRELGAWGMDPDKDVPEHLMKKLIKACAVMIRKGYKPKPKELAWFAQGGDEDYDPIKYDIDKIPGGKAVGKILDDIYG